MTPEAKENLTRVSDGNLYDLNDLVKVGCHDCAGCSGCCRDMGQSVLLDPYDCFRLTLHFNQTFEQLLTGPVELHLEDNLILPNLKMTEHKSFHEPACVFLNNKGRCSIHAPRPGLCRIFPLGRNYEDGQLRYFLLKDACPAKNKTKLKISKWLDTENLRENQEYLISWHTFTKQFRAVLTAHAADPAAIKQLQMAFLQHFYLTPYSTVSIPDTPAQVDFYAAFRERLETGKTLLKINE